MRRVRTRRRCPSCPAAAGPAVILFSTSTASTASKSGSLWPVGAGATAGEVACRRGPLRVSSPSRPSTKSGPAPRVERVVARAAGVRGGLVAAGERVVARAGVGHHGDQRAEAGAGGQRVVTAERVQLEHLAGGDVERERGVRARVVDLARDDGLGAENVVGGLAPLTSILSRPASPFIWS